MSTSCGKDEALCTGYTVSHKLLHFWSSRFKLWPKREFGDFCNFRISWIYNYHYLKYVSPGPAI